jgi:putative transposase
METLFTTNQANDSFRAKEVIHCKANGYPVTDVRRLKQLEDENKRLKALVADLTIEKHQLQEAVAKKAVKPAQKQVLVEFLIVGYKLAKRRACELIGLNPSSYHYQSQAKDQTALKMKLRDLAAARVRNGYRRLHVLLQREGWQINHKRVFRIYRQEGLSLRNKKAKKRISASRMVGRATTAPNRWWSMDFMTDRLVVGRRYRILTLVDHFSRVSPALEAEYRFPAKQAIATLERVAATQKLPEELYVDNGPEFISKALDAWAQENGVKLCFSRPGKPTDNAYIESFNGKLRVECLDQNWSASLAEAKEKLSAHRNEHNTERLYTA